jgi:hypothetical protein
VRRRHVFKSLNNGCAFAAIGKTIYLGQLSSRGCIARQEARRAHRAMHGINVPIYYASGGEPFYEDIESVIERHIYKGLGGMWLRKSSGIGDNLGDLASRNAIAWPEARSAGIAWRAGVIAIDDASAGHAPHVAIEG